MQAYPMSQEVRGRAVIINIEWYHDRDLKRPGSAIDRENLENLFQALNFETSAVEWEDNTLEVCRDIGCTVSDSK